MKIFKRNHFFLLLFNVHEKNIIIFNKKNVFLAFKKKKKLKLLLIGFYFQRLVLEKIVQRRRTHLRSLIVMLKDNFLSCIFVRKKTYFDVFLLFYFLNFFFLVCFSKFNIVYRFSNEKKTTKNCIKIKLCKK